MHKTKKIWFGAFIATFIILIIGYSFFRFYLQKDFVRYDFVPCDAASYSCFVAECAEDDPRCAPYRSEEGMYSFSVLKIDRNQKTEYYCSEEMLLRFENLIFDVECSLSEEPF